MRESFGTIIEARPGEQLLDLPKEYVEQVFALSGAILFRGFAADTDSFLRFSARFSAEFSTYQGGALRWKAFDRQMIDGIPTLLTTTGHNQTFPIPLHGEMYYGNDRPDILWFRCVKAPAFAGETVLAESSEMAAALSDRTRALFESRNLKYTRDLPAEDWPVAYQTHDIEEVREACSKAATRVDLRQDGSLRTEFICSAFAEKGRFINSILPLTFAERAYERGKGWEDSSQSSPQLFPVVVRFEDGSRIPAAAIEDIERAAEQVTFKILWRDGDLVIVDNRRVMHGRARTVGNDRVIQVRMGLLERSV
jgi:alpha-ketoglutarate-dependent taurine dioxygenase